MLRKIPLSLKVVKTLNDNIYGIRNIRSQDYSFPGTFVPMMELSFSGPFVPWNIRSQDYSFPGTFVPWTVRSMELSFPGTVVPGTTLDLSCRGPFVYLSAEQYNWSGTA